MPERIVYKETGRGYILQKYDDNTSGGRAKIREAQGLLLTDRSISVLPTPQGPSHKAHEVRIDLGGLKSGDKAVIVATQVAGMTLGRILQGQDHHGRVQTAAITVEEMSRQAIAQAGHTAERIVASSFEHALKSEPLPREQLQIKKTRIEERAPSFLEMLLGGKREPHSITEIRTLQREGVTPGAYKNVHYPDMHTTPPVARIESSVAVAISTHKKYGSAQTSRDAGKALAKVTGPGVAAVAGMSDTLVGSSFHMDGGPAISTGAGDYNMSIDW